MQMRNTALGAILAGDMASCVAQDFESTWYKLCDERAGCVPGRMLSSDVLWLAVTLPHSGSERRLFGVI